MEAKHSLKDTLMKAIEKLPEDQLDELLHFVEYLRAKKNQQSDEQRVQESAHQPDPLDQYIGGVSSGSLAHDIDEELYN